MILIGLTGGIACGKSTVSKILGDEFHMEIIDADLIVRELQAPNTKCTKRIAARWPGCVNAVTGELDRVELGRIVFSDTEARRELGKIMNPAIFRAIMQRIAAAWWHDVFHTLLGTKQAIVVLDAPTLFETKTFTYFISASVVVSCSEERQIDRLCRRNLFTREEALQRICSQMPLKKKCQLADHVLVNDGADDLEELRAAVRDCVDWMSKQCGLRLTCLFAGAATVALGMIGLISYAALRQTLL